MFTFSLGVHVLISDFDHFAMITIHHERYGVYNTKPLPVIWAMFPEYSRENTIMVFDTPNDFSYVQFDDLRRNFMMNPGNVRFYFLSLPNCQGLKIRPFRYSALSSATDRELLNLTDYLLLLKSEPDFSIIRHSVPKQWRIAGFLTHRNGKDMLKKGLVCS